MNLLKETLVDIEASGHTVDDIVFIGSSDGEYRCTWPEFEAMANADYSPGVGAAEVAQDLIIVFSDGQTMWRGEDDSGSEWWVYSKPFVMPESSKPINKLFASITGWESVSEIHSD